MATDKIRKVAVIGAGVMGRGIAAHLANARIPTILLDIVPPNPDPDQDTSDPEWRNSFAQGAIDKMRKESPSPIFSERDLDLIVPGNTSDHLEWLADVDWIVEVVPEKMSIKRSVFDDIEEHADPEAIITSNTSGLSIAGMLEGRSDAFRERFLVTHFFNPVRYMKLLELVEGEDTDPAVTETMATFGEEVLGKGIVYGKDTTNFIANRIGVYGIMLIMHEMHDYDMTVEGVDVLFGKPLARPKSAVFRTADLVGLDTLVHVANNCHETLEDDEERGVFEVPDFVGEMVDNEWLGSKTGKGFYEKTSEGIQALRLDSMEYEPRDKPKFESTDVKGNPPAERVRLVLHEGEDRAADFARLVTLRTLAYSARRLGEIADDIVNIDRAMRWGFSWDLGPFETWDAVGLEWGVEKMDELDIDVPDWVREMVDAEGVDAFYTWDGATKKYYDPDSGEYREVPFDDRELAQLEFTERREDTEIMGNSSATLWDMGDGVACLQFHTKMNAIDPDIIEMMHDSIAYVEDHDWNGLVVGNDAENFSAGANLLLVVGNAMQEQWEPIEEMVTRFQQANQRLRYSRKPVVTAPAGRTLGGGAEVAMSGNIVQAAGESYVGLVEVGVGLIPGGGGNLQLMRNVMGRHSDSKDVEQQAFLKQIFMTIGTAQYSMSAEEAREMGFLTEADHVSMNRSYQLHDAKQAVLGLANSGFIPPRPSKFRLPGEAGAATIDMMLYSMVQNGQISEYDRHIGRKLAHVMCGGSTSPTVLVTEERLLELEREVFLSLCGEEKSQARMKHMLQEGKPLRN